MRREKTPLLLPTLFPRPASAPFASLRLVLAPRCLAPSPCITPPSPRFVLVHRFHAPSLCSLPLTPPYSCASLPCPISVPTSPHPSCSCASPPRPVSPSHCPAPRCLALPRSHPAPHSLSLPRSTPCPCPLVPHSPVPPRPSTLLPCLLVLHPIPAPLATPPCITPTVPCPAPFVSLSRVLSRASRLALPVSHSASAPVSCIVEVFFWSLCFGENFI